MEKYPNFNILLNAPKHYLPKAEFALRTYCRILRLNPKFFYGKQSEGIHLYYGELTSQPYPIRIHFDPATADFFEQEELYPLEKVNFRRYQKEDIPFLFSLNGEILSFTENTCSMRKDIIAGGFYFLTCWHEYILARKGIPKGRVDFRESLQYRWDFSEIPVVDVYCQILYRVISIVLPEFIRDIHWQEKKAFALSLSHDVDYWHYWTKDQLIKTYRYNLTTLTRRPFAAIYKSCGHFLHKTLSNHPQAKIEHILKREDALNVQSTWFILARDDFDDSRQNYCADPKAMAELISSLGQRDVGLHGSPQAAFSLTTLLQELNTLKSLGFNPSGFRTHYLHFDYQQSFSILEEAGLSYDSTLGYWEHAGYRAGTSFPFYPFNLKENRPFRVLEIPLIVMDTTLHSHKAMNLSPWSAYLRVSRLMSRSAQYQSHLSLLWHNTTFDLIDFPLWGALYWRFIRKAQKTKGWVTSLSQIYDEWVNLSY